MQNQASSHGNSNPPWLDSLSDDWVPVPGTPSPVPTRSILHSHQSSLQDSPSRIPVPARHRSVEQSPGDPKKKVTRPCHFIRREPPTPKGPRTPRTPKLRTPVHKNHTPRTRSSSKPTRTPKSATKKSPKPTVSASKPKLTSDGLKPNVPAARKQHYAINTRSPLRSVSNVSSQSSQPGQPSLQGTVQVRPKDNNKDRESTPEWRKRLVHGELPTGEQRDLFAPIGLESVFKPPTPGSEATRHDQIPMFKQSRDIWNFSESRDPNMHNPAMDSANESHREDAGDSNGKDPVSQDTKRDNTSSPRGSPADALKVKKGGEEQNRNNGNHSSLNDTQLRTASGLEDLRNEGITPITFSQSNPVDGNGTSEIIKSALKQVSDKLEGLSLRAGDRPGSRASDSALLHPQSEVPADALPLENELLDVTSNSLPQDLSVGTLGAFARCHRTDFLGEGSLLKPRLTPSPLPSQRLSPQALWNSRIRSSPPFFPKTNPLTDPPTLVRPLSAHSRSSTTERSAKGKVEGMPSSGSPLKLFGNHDTFTNNKLLRRMSQFEETFGHPSDEDEPVSPSEEARRKGENRSLLSVKLDRPSSRRSRVRATNNPKLERFGDGDLDHFDFSDTSPYEPKLLYHEIPDSEYRPSSRRRSSISRWHYQQTSLDDHDHEHSSQPDHRSSADDNSADDDSLDDDKLKQRSSIRSMEKNPKRRRTILRSDTSDYEDEDARNLPGRINTLSLLQKSLMQHGIEDSNEHYLAQSRSTQRPRTVTPGQSMSSTRKRSSSHWHPDDTHIGEESPSETAVPRVQVTGVNDEVRRGSITTQDYLNEATRVMDMIRSKGRNTGGLPSLEELDMEGEEDDDSYDDGNEDDDESTREEFSRPPSRDGVDLRKLREPNEPNPHVMSYLRKFQENDDPDFGVSTSVASLHLNGDQQPGLPSRDIPHSFDQNPADGAERDHNDAPNGQQVCKHSVASADDDGGTINTQMSSKSIPTGSSQGSYAKGVLSSDVVSHLIPEQVNGFTYDRFRQKWVKEKAKQTPEKPKGEDSEDDPFRDIPDLSIDEFQEMMRMQSSPSNKTDDGRLAEEVDDPQSPLSAKRPPTRDGAPSVMASSVQSKASRFASADPDSGTRATSLDTDQHKKGDCTSEVEHEIKLHEGRLSKPPRRQRAFNQQARAVTVNFSSPPVSRVAYSDNYTPTKYMDQELAADQEQEGQAGNMQPSEAQTLGDNHLSARQSTSREDDSEEGEDERLSVVRQNNEAALSTPLTRYQENSLVRFQGPGHDTSYSFNLSPLPDFTVHQIDKPLHLELSYVANRTNPTSLRQVHGTFALATEDLVKHLTEVEPFEPYWEHVRRLILRDKGLITLHKLSDFCPRLEDLDVSENDIGQLSGIPVSLRTLRIQRNCLTGLTAWGHLVNLQYLDVSGNELESLDGFGSLIHLREIKANDNNIRNIEGIRDLNGLLSLKLSNNSLTSVDFEGAELTRLNELDLSYNVLTSVQNLHLLPSVSALNLSFNRLTEVDFPVPMYSLRSLKLSNNHLGALDIAMCPSLTLLYADQNSLWTISGLQHCHILEVLSAREQMVPERDGDKYFDIDLGQVRGIRKVFLSSNKLSAQSVSPSAPLLSLQLLDIASCKLENLPAEFSLNFPNVKVLNLNFNALAGVTELAGMNCLSRLAVAGNRITRMRRLCQALSYIGRTSRNSACSLQKVDVRGNPLTVRFYPPSVTGSGKPTENRRLHGKEAERESERPQSKATFDLPAALADMSQHQSEGIAHPALWGEIDGELEDVDMDADQDRDRDIEINDPYTLPLADAEADTKYFSHLDESTRLRRSILELMIYAGTGGSVKYLDGLELRPMLQEGSDMGHAWTKLEKLGVLRKKAITD